MNRPHPYRPPLPQPPAALIRVATYDTRSHNFRGTHTATAQHLRGRRWLHTSTTAHCSLFTAHWTYTFSAKERDPETGLSYFGSRYYSSDLSIWLSVDPMAAKYPQESPYVFCGNNPIIFKDPNGREKVISYNTTSGTNSDQTRNKHLTNAANNFAENRGVIHLWAHGMVSGDGKCVGITTYSSQTAEYDIYSTNELDQFLSDNSKIYATNDNQTAILVMHCCKTGQEDALAQKASKDLNLLVVAPSDDITFSTSKYSDGREYSQETGVANGGSWVIYYKGEKMNSFSGKTPPLFDNPEQVIRRYEEEYRQKHPDEALAD